jgi:hypothetical protein
MGVFEEKIQLEGSCRSERADLIAEVEESPLLEAVTRERQVKTAGLEINDGAIIACTYELCV